jgi:hypothetical protein
LSFVGANNGSGTTLSGGGAGCAGGGGAIETAIPGGRGNGGVRKHYKSYSNPTPPDTVGIRAIFTISDL